MCSNFDLSYFHEGQRVLRLNDNDWNSDEQQPKWLGFSHEDKPFKLEEIPVKLSQFCKMEKVTNPYLERAFELKKSQLGVRSTMTVYHGTIDENVNSIVRNNFNWRLAGTSRGVKHGRGVCFSEAISFAHRFCAGVGKRIIEANILYSCAATGYNGDELPRFGCDTAKSPNGNVLVKFEDSEFLPLHICYFSE